MSWPSSNRWLRPRKQRKRSEIENRTKNREIVRDRRQATMTRVHDVGDQRLVTTIDVADDPGVAIDSQIDAETDLGVETDPGDNVLVLEAAIGKKVADPTIPEEVLTSNEPHPLILS